MTSPSQRRRLLLLLAVVSAGLHFYRLSEPRSVVFDEVWFGDFVNAYTGSGAYFLDVHPPHAKLLIAGVAALGGYHGEQEFSAIHHPITAVSPALLRFVPALAGTLIPLLVFGLLIQLHGQQLGSAIRRSGDRARQLPLDPDADHRDRRRDAGGHARCAFVLPRGRSRRADGPTG
jgi:dolichyl-phosphate-mannose--protein O-mannosyl transferase